MRIGREVLRHIFVDCLLKVDTDGPIRANNLIGADTGVGGNVSAWVGDPVVCRIVPDMMVRPLNRCSDEPAEEFLTNAGGRSCLRNHRRKRRRHRNQ